MMSESHAKKPFEAYRGSGPYIFISYAHDDEEDVYAELIRLNRLGFNIWYDEGINPGSEWTDELAERITNCALFLFLVTPRSVASQNCRDEANFALESANPVLAVHLEETELPPGLKLRMGSRQAVLKYKLDAASYERKLHAAIKARLSGSDSDEKILDDGFRIGKFDVEPLGGTLTPVDGEPLHLEPKVMDVLIILAGSANKIVTREQLLESVWTGQVAADELLTRAISELRRAFGDGPSDSKYIQTVPKRGYRLIGQIESGKSAAPQADNTVTGVGTSVSNRKRAYVAVAVAALVIAFFIIDRIVIYPSQSVGSDLSDSGATDSTPNTAIQAARPKPLTSMEGFEWQAALSPDGNYVAFVWLGRFLSHHGVIYVQRIDGGGPTRLTDSDEPEFFPAWSPDGTQVAFIRNQADGNHDIIVKPILPGGFETRIATIKGFAIELDWSTDGNFLAFQGTPEEGSAQGIYLVSVTSGAIRAFTQIHDASSYVRPKFSPDGKSLAFIRIGGGAGGADICVQDLEQSEPRCITPEDRGWLIQDFDWTSDSQAIVAVRGGLSGLSSLVRISVATGIYMDLPFGDGAMDVTIARFGGRLVFERLFQDHNLWRTAGPNATVSAEPSKLIASTWDEISPEYSPDGTKLAFISARSGSWEVWVADADGANARQLTNWGFAAFPSWSPDSQQIAFSTGLFDEASDDQSASSDGFKLNETFVLDASAGIPRLVTQGRHGAKNPSWSRDGRWIYFESHRRDDCGWQLGKSNVDTGEEVQLARCIANPVEGPDQRVYFLDNENETISSVTVDGEDLRTDIGTPAGCDFYYEGWTFWERNLIYIDCEDLKIKALDLDTREVRDLASVFEEDKISLSLGLTVSPDGNWITYTQLDRAGSDLMLVEPFQ